MSLRILSSLLLVTTALAASVLGGCAADDEDGQGTGEEDIRRARRASEGGVCGNGVFGAPKIDCASGLECVYRNGSTAPSGPTGSSSASTGTCQKSGAKEGETCGNGVFGSPKIDCASGLACVYPNGSNAPTGPSGSSSASTGTCATQ